MLRFESLPDALAARLREDRHLLFVDGEDTRRTLSFARLSQRAHGLLGALQRKGLQPGDAMILFLNDSERFLEMFWACVLGGIVPVPIAVGAGEEHRRKLFRVFAQFDRAFVYGETRTMERMDVFAGSHGLAAEWTRLEPQILLSGSLDATGAPGKAPLRRPDDVAFIQYSSGSTSEPKGVVLTHRNLCANIASIAEAAAFTDRDVALSWMPLSHDMGLIGFHLNMLFCGVTHGIMRTDLFARRPLLWLSLATEMRATILCSPNFGYQHYLKQYGIKAPQGLDLSAVRLLFNGAEPISAELCERFLRTMAPHGLKASSMFPVYGLAEASLAVTFPRPGAPLETVHADRSAFRIGEPVRAVPPGDAQAAAFVKLGRPIPGVEVRIVDEAGGTVADGALGRVLMRGDNVTRGYWRDEAATAAARSADGWLDTGDLGFFADAQLVIAGRAKDIVFVNGQNYYPHDLERIAEQVEGVEANKVAAAGVPDAESGTEKLVLFVQHRGTIEDFVPLAVELRRVLGQQTGLTVAHVLPVQRIPKTTSGKLQRHALVRAFENGELASEIAALAPRLETAVAAPTAPETPAGGGGKTVDRLKAICDQVIPEKRLAVTTNLFEIDLNSLTLARIHEGIDREFPDRLEVTDLFDYPTLEELADFLDRQR